MAEFTSVMSFFVNLELDALGDDFLTEDDSFLDDTLPNPPTKDPVGSDTVKSKVIYLLLYY